MPNHHSNPILNQQIVTCIKQLRKEKKVTLEVFYFDTGIHLARIEQGKQNMTISTLSKICSYFEMKMSDFFKLVESQN